MKTRTITLKKKDIFFDIDKLSLSLAEASGLSDVRVSDAVSTETGTTGGTRIYTRLADKRVSDIKTLLKDFSPATTQSEGNDLIANADYSIVVYITDEWSDTMINPIIAQMHDYVVKGALADWYAEIGSGPAANLSQMAVDSFSKIKELIYQRPIPTML